MIICGKFPSQGTLLLLMKTQENTSEGRQIKIQNVLSKGNSLFAMAVEYTTTLKGLQI